MFKILSRADEINIPIPPLWCLLATSGFGRFRSLAATLSVHYVLGLE